VPGPPVTQPIPGPAAFHETGHAAWQSQAAVLLILGLQLRGDDVALTARSRASRSGGGGVVAAIPADDAAEFPVPRVRPTGERFAPESVQAALVQRYGAAIREGADRPGEPGRPLTALADLAERLYRRPTPSGAAQLLEVCLGHPVELVRVAAAASYFEASTGPRRLIAALEDGTHDDDELTRVVAATALARIAPAHPRLRELTQDDADAATSEPAHTSLLVHGTFARDNAWWQPGGDFHRYLLTDVRPDLYKAPDRFDWSGGYSDAARAIGATDLEAWVANHDLDGLDLFTHSHGGSVAMLASQGGLRIGELVLLSCPVRVPKYLPAFGRVGRAVSIRVRLDLVILADGGGQRFREPNIEEHVLPIWFDHFATHAEQVWKGYNVPAMVW
jgi:hypothetical protein